MDKKINTAMGGLKISGGVIVKIAELAAMEIKGVSTAGNHLETAENPLLIANRFISPIRVSLKGEAAEINVNIIVVEGHKAVRVAESAQRSVKSAVQNMTGIAVSKVNVKIAGIRANGEAVQ
ncbi:MAG: Asp23/Gls24 family envelope stress response protein [Oscillospiraceae bacterium]|jgi:uncharacterized alkaline shock family protein YloU|nr:Asp23/Gls24 family envelope stress response protein [Oscillospiraceae bacterium]